MRSPCLGSTVASGCCSMPAMRTLSEANAGVTQLVEYLPSKQAVASSSLVPRSTPNLRENCGISPRLRGTTPWGQVVSQALHGILKAADTRFQIFARESCLLSRDGPGMAEINGPALVGSIAHAAAEL